MPIYLVTGPAIPDSILSLTALIIFILIIKNSDYFYFNSFIFKIFILIIFSFLISSFLSDDIIFSFESSLFYFRFIFFSIAIFYLSIKTNFLKYLLYAFFLSLLIVVFDGYWEYVFDNSFFLGTKTHDPARLSGLFRDEMIIGSYLARSLPIVFGLYFFIYNTNKKINLIFYIFSILIYVLIFLSGERTAFILSTMFFIIFYLKYLNLQKKIIFAFFLMFSTLAMLFSNSTIKDRMIHTTIDTIKISLNNESQILPGVYDNMLKTSYNMFLDNPTFGIGPKMYRVKCSFDDYGFNTESCFTHPHNHYFQLLAETGLVGTSLVLIFYIYICSILINYFRKNLDNYSRYDHISFFMITSVFINFWPLITSTSFFNNWINVFYFLPLGIYLFSSSHLKKNNEK